MTAASGVTRADAGKAPREPRVIPLRPMSGDVEILYGDPEASGQPFVMRIRELAGTVVPPHAHPVDEHITVVQGTWYFGFGEKFDASVLAELKPGAYAFAPKGSWMFGYSPEAAIVQVHGVGPFQIQWHGGLKALDDPDAKSTLRFSRGDRVSAARGSGRIVEATPPARSSNTRSRECRVSASWRTSMRSALNSLSSVESSIDNHMVGVRRIQ